MDEEAQALSTVLTGKEHESLESDKTKKKSRETSVDSTSDTEKTRQVSTESNDFTNNSQQNIGDSQSSFKNSQEGSNSITSGIEYLMHTYQVFDSKKLRKKARRMAIQMMEQIGYTVMVVTPGKFAIKYASSAPYHLFFTRVDNSKETYNQQFSIIFSEILDRSLGEIVNSLHLTFMVDVTWLYLQYLLVGQRTDMTILCKHKTRVHEELSKNITIIKVDGQEFSSHHTNIMILQYKNGIRVIVSTAGLYSADWENRTQGLWISPHLPYLPESAHPSDGESSTGFKKDLERYLSKYDQPVLTQWICVVRRIDFSDVNVFLVASVPGIHKGFEANFWGCKKLAYVLSRYVTLPPDTQWPIVIQSSGVGCFGSTIESWLLKDIIRCMWKETSVGLKNHPQFQFIYPSIENYKQSFDCQDLITPLMYSAEIHSKQQWLEQYLYQWKATRTGRDHAMPNIKSYTRISSDSKRIPWFLLTSANLSKAAWGSIKQYEGYSIRNYEAGVVFIPKLITGTATFPIEEEEDAAVPIFPIPYDLPLSRYDLDDSPFVNEFVDSLN
ncbi:PREDICTED: probable tyrosyl-DNA phosphodiesterase isoform X1 [Trachymyrmex cornetzi]|uniref:Putative tyrosyl-DNA phosphodiesterase n=1 Tax=Trachymyrmex cornetzi TaxID=471704 RepID=A0A151ISX4_9HYME|nr:PREDICTED: probable tyrosyl-DNA phosphodiesterase isoform X1 [Trachymyrmex cornetzi]KYN10018.1 putative tyrosyl-DNA phosphodiesterase [Trachymyrmex cornetzi]